MKIQEFVKRYKGCVLFQDLDWEPEDELEPPRKRQPVAIKARQGFKNKISKAKAVMNCCICSSK